MSENPTNLKNDNHLHNINYVIWLLRQYNPIPSLYFMDQSYEPIVDRKAIVWQTLDVGFIPPDDLIDDIKSKFQIGKYAIRNGLAAMNSPENVRQKGVKFIKITPRQFGFSEATHINVLINFVFLKTWSLVHLDNAFLNACDYVDGYYIAQQLAAEEGLNIKILGSWKQMNSALCFLDNSLEFHLVDFIDLDQELVYRIVELDPSS